MARQMADNVVRVCAQSDIAPETVKAFEVGDNRLAVYNIAGTLNHRCFLAACLFGVVLYRALIDNFEAGRNRFSGRLAGGVLVQIDTNVIALQDDFISPQRHHAWRRRHLAGLHVKRAEMDATFDRVAFQ